MKPELTTERLLASGFNQVGCWELNSMRDLAHSIDLPTRAGVYAFAIDGVVQYVGLASKSLRQRLGFYRKPGASQRTNIRLNEIIRTHIHQGTVVQIFIAQPPDHGWNGFRISGAEGLEAGLISEYHLPWNVRGAQPRSAMEQPMRSGASKRRQSGVAQKIVEVVQRQPGITELEIAKAIYGPAAVQQQVNQDCRLLARNGVIERRGIGGRSDPYVYFPYSNT
jgi:hypothetical protein